MIYGRSQIKGVSKGLPKKAEKRNVQIAGQAFGDVALEKKRRHTTKNTSQEVTLNGDLHGEV
jgi:hypothetical protein